MDPHGVNRIAVGAAGGAAVLWATYYLFVLSLPTADNLAIILLTPGIGGAVTLLAALRIERPDWAGLRRALSDPRVLAAGVLLLAFQFGAVLAIRSVGAVNVSLIVLASDVVGTPLIVVLLLHREGPRFRNPTFLTGVGLIALAGTVTIVAGGSPEPLSLITLALGLPLFLVSCLFVVTTDLATRRQPVLVVLGVGPLVVSAVASLVAVAVVGAPAVIGATDLRSLLLLLLMSLTNYTLAPALFFWSARRISLVLPSVLQAAIPVFTLIYVGVSGLQPVTAVGLVGVPLCFLGALVAVRSTMVGESMPASIPVP